MTGRPKDKKSKSGEKDASEAKKKAQRKSHSKAKPEDFAEESPATPDLAESKPDKVKEDNLEGKLLRLQADFDNFRKRMVREKGEVWQRASEDIIGELIPVLDHMDLALAAAAEHEAPDAFVEGFKLVRNQMAAAMGKYGLDPIVTDGAVFDPNLHEAVSYLASDDVDASGIIAETRKGYMLGDRLLRASQVVVSSGLPQTREQGAEESEQVDSPVADQKGQV